MTSVRTEMQAMADLDAITPLWMMTTATDTQTVIVSATGRSEPVTVRGLTRRDALNAALHALRKDLRSAASEETGGNR